MGEIFAVRAPNKLSKDYLNKLVKRAISIKILAGQKNIKAYDVVKEALEMYVQSLEQKMQQK